MSGRGGRAGSLIDELKLVGPALADPSSCRLHPEIGREPDIPQQVGRQRGCAAPAIGPEDATQHRVGTTPGDEQTQAPDEAELPEVKPGRGEDARSGAVPDNENHLARPGRSPVLW